MTGSGTVAASRAEPGNLRYEYYQSFDNPETVLLIDSWEDQAAIDAHHASPMMATIIARREKYDLHMTVERYRSGVDSFTFIVYDDKSEKLYSIGGALNVQYEGETVNRVLSIFDIGNPAAFLSNKNKHLVTTDEKTAKEILEKAGIQSPALQDILDRTEIVPQVKQNVNTQSSTRQRDAEYAELAIDPSGNERQLQRMVDEAAMEAMNTEENEADRRFIRK